MHSARFLARSSRTLKTVRPAQLSYRPFSVCASRFNEDSKRDHKTVSEAENKAEFDNLRKRTHPNVEEHREREIKTPLNPHLTNTTSTQFNDIPSVGANNPPPDFLATAAKKQGNAEFQPADSVPENTEKMTGGTQKSGNPSDVKKRNFSSSSSSRAVESDVKPEDAELGVGELEGASFRVEPLRRTGEDVNTMRARLLYQSRKRGTLESELLMSTFADANLPTMTAEQLRQYDLFLDENDWDIYYWATQEPTPTSAETAQGNHGGLATSTAKGQDIRKREPASGEWAQTVGTFKPAYRPVPKRWQDSEILNMLRDHVKRRSAGGESGDGNGKDGKGLGMMPDIRNFDQH